QSFSNAWVVGAAALLATVLSAFAASAPFSASRPIALAGRAAIVLATAMHLFWLYLAIAFGSLLGWSTPWWARGLVALAALAAVFTARPSWRRVRIPLALPLGIWIAACLAGWRREEAFLRCDDLLRAAQQPGVSVVMATTREQTSCRAGQVLPIGRY